VTRIPLMPVALIVLALGMSSAARAAQHPVPLEKGVQETKCLECHNSDAARSTTGSGNSANGPHSSKWTHLLERRYDMNTAPATPGGSTNSIPYAAGGSGPYGMCDKCHDVDRKLINGGDSVFGRHQRHVVRGGISCSSCHNPHGVQGSDTTHHGGLIDIDAVMARRQDNTAFTVPAAPNPNVGINTTTRNCSLTCHGHQHNNKKY
jgi:hypothetical protein